MLAVAQPAHPSHFIRPDDPTGAAFEAISDAVDDINVAKFKQSGAYDASEFDANKDKATFRQFVDENEQSRKFYM